LERPHFAVLAAAQTENRLKASLGTYNT